MSKLLNRNVNTVFNVFGLPHEPIQRSDNPNCNEQPQYSQVKIDTPNTIDSDVESIILDLNKLGGLSSSSSLSWSDDYEIDITKKVYDELKKLDQVLKGEECIPTNYDKDECEEWMKFFPNLSIFDDDKTPTNSLENLSAKKGHFKKDSHQYDCDMISSKEISTVMLSSPKLMKAYETTPLVSRKRKLRSQNRYANDNFYTVSSKPKSLDIDQYLKVSPIVQNKRKQSSKSLLNRQISRESPYQQSEYSSLPHIKIDSLPTLKLQKSSQERRKKPYSKTSGRIDNRLILPPINSDLDHFRSHSGLPNDSFKAFSALSDNSEFKGMLNKKKHSLIPMEHPVNSSRK